MQYATQAEYEAYVPGWTTTDPAALNVLLRQASRDVDYLLGPQEALAATGLKYDPTKLAVYERTALMRATCAQAEYLTTVDPAQFVTGRAPRSLSGPDFSVTYGSPSGSVAEPLARFAPKLRVELAPIAHLRRLTASIG